MSPTNNIRSRRSRLLALAGTGATIVRAAYENLFIGQQFLIIDQTLEPYEFPPNKLAEILAKVPTEDAKYPIQGYNIFAPASGGQVAPEAVEGWQLQVRLTTDISLEGADPLFPVDDISVTVEDNRTEEGDGGEDFCEDDEDNPKLNDLRNKVFDAVLISLLPPNNLISTETEPSLSNSTRINSTMVKKGLRRAAGGTSWTVCAAVWVAGLFMDNSTNISNSSTPPPFPSQDMSPDNSSSCTGLVSDQCITDMAAEFNSAPGGNCKNRTLPSSCQAAFTGQDDGSTAVNLAQTLVGSSNDMFTFNMPMFAASTYPRELEDSQTAEALELVSDWAFPIVMSWTPPGGGTTQSHLSCVGINKGLEAAAPRVTPGDTPSPAVVSSGAGSNCCVSTWGVVVFVGGAMSISRLL